MSVSTMTRSSGPTHAGSACIGHAWATSWILRICRPSVPFWDISEAEAKAMNLKAEAYQEYNQAAIADKLIGIDGLRAV